MRRDLSLPEGYRVREVEGYLYLFDAQGIPLVGPTDAATIEAHAWHDAWRRIDRELSEELEAFRADARPLHELRRLRQYMRMLDAVTRASGKGERKPVPGTTIRWAAVAASAAAVAAVFVMAFARMAGPPEHPATPVSPDTFAQTQLTKLQTATSAVPSGATSGSTGAPVHTTVAATRRKAVRAAHAVPRRPVIVKYAVSFGDFASHATANRLVHVIGGKGYIVHVATVGGNARVVTRPFHTRKQAARLAHALREIGLPAALTAIREF